MKLRLFVLPDGSITGRYADVVQFALGVTPAAVRRVTNVEWSEATGLWKASTITGRCICTAPTRQLCLDAESVFVDRLLQQFYRCRRPDGEMWCPDCNCHVGQHIHLNCPHCGFEFPMAQDGFSWVDFQLDHLVTP